MKDRHKKGLDDVLSTILTIPKLCAGNTAND